MYNYFKNEDGHTGQENLGEGLCLLAMAMERLAYSSDVTEEEWSEAGSIITKFAVKLANNLTESNQKKFEKYLLHKIEKQDEVIERLTKKES